MINYSKLIKEVGFSKVDFCDYLKTNYEALNFHIGTERNPKIPRNYRIELGIKAALLEKKLESINLSINDLIVNDAKAQILLQQLDAKNQILEKHSEVLASSISKIF